MPFYMPNTLFYVHCLVSCFESFFVLFVSEHVALSGSVGVINFINDIIPFCPPPLMLKQPRNKYNHIKRNDEEISMK